MDNLPCFYEVDDPKHQSRDLRDLIREALLNPKTSQAVRDVIADGQLYGHKILRFDGAWGVIENYLGDRLTPYKNVDRYAKQQKLRGVLRERLEIDKKWRLTGNKAKRLTVVKAA